MLKKVLRSLNNIFKLSVMSTIICSLLMLTLIIVNSIMGIFIGLDYYLMVFGVLTIGLTFGLTLFNYKKVFCSKRKIKRNKGSLSNKVSREKYTVASQTKRKIS